MRQFRLNILRLHRMKRQTSDKCTELRLRLLIICTLELRERCYHLDRRCGCYPDWDNVKRGLTICEICRISSSTFEIGQCIFVSEQGQKFHLTRFCRTFKSLRVTEYARCTACCTLEHSTQVLFGDSVPRQRRTASSTSSIAGMSED